MDELGWGLGVDLGFLHPDNSLGGAGVVAFALLVWREADEFDVRRVIFDLVSQGFLSDSGFDAENFVYGKLGLGFYGFENGTRRFLEFVVFEMCVGKIMDVFLSGVVVPFCKLCVYVNTHFY